MARLSPIAAGLALWLAAAAPGLASEHVVTIAKMAFGPPPSGLRVGDVVVWKNDDIFRHTATAHDGSFDVDLPAHTEKRVTLRKAGSFAFYCRFHPGMTGTLSVSP
ncbi:MAG: cupredoxin domain-containing protein [Pararhizobium sp.]